jgi:hypothetical protein
MAGWSNISQTEGGRTIFTKPSSSAVLLIEVDRTAYHNDKDTQTCGNSKTKTEMIDGRQFLCGICGLPRVVAWWP